MSIIDFQNKKLEINARDILDVYIQDPINNCGYLITGTELVKHFHVVESEAQNTIECITFAIPDADSLTSAVPTFNQSDKENCPIKVYDMATKSCFIIPRNILANYKVKLDEFNPHGISFIMPIQSDLIEELPAMMRGLLQTGEAVVILGMRKDPMPATANKK